MTFEILVAFLTRLSLVLLFLPFSALDKVLNFADATKQAGQATSSHGVAKALILTGLFVEVVMSLGVLTGVADRLAAFILSGYCAVTAVLFKQFWRAPDFRLRGPSTGRETLWDFLKNFAVAGGFLLVTFGPTAGSVDRFFADPFGSTHPYSLTETQP
ncbi:DoxX family protein [Aureimonas jatrophae]|uniref:Putative oxidoreductase n=1 Tax=Aureimonas jatrophae TaxID=1166073 RepID=A0A1H0JAX7_9HYPH|nr:DoxX family protein [Aureimonas jatrophae]MBB3951503.1 putative oxidoreductase [Aureimonas jatrophae]SDO40826.1 putative oxidoreductase [Aureimonas jatrophae]